MLAAPIRVGWEGGTPWLCRAMGTGTGMAHAGGTTQWVLPDTGSALPAEDIGPSARSRTLLPRPAAGAWAPSSSRPSSAASGRTASRGRAARPPRPPPCPRRHRHPMHPHRGRTPRPRSLREQRPPAASFRGENRVFNRFLHPRPAAASPARPQLRAPSCSRFVQLRDPAPTAGGAGGRDEAQPLLLRANSYSLNRVK